MGGQEQEGHLVSRHQLEQILHTVWTIGDYTTTTVEERGQKNYGSRYPVEGTEREQHAISGVGVRTVRR